MAGPGGNSLSLKDLVASMALRETFIRLNQLSASFLEVVRRLFLKTTLPPIFLYPYQLRLFR